MANFVNKITEIQYNSIQDFVTHYIEDVESGLEINIFADWKNTGKLISALADKTLVTDIEYAFPDINGYDYEYNIGIVHTDDNINELFVERAYDSDRKNYIDNYEHLDAGIVIGEISDELRQKLEEECNNIVIISF